ncbi:hypothetical protein A4G99_07325 [Haladaptatus sp. R4]|uniref:thrombospondin type 3 repeat-containing protein n=1 Tax=Haladaptatus sp. R4 TaxID=1679489 RepID=UPI0007B4BA3D|nr:thrombospondin type 3 repeat-containing protein [Haladaptatus sp. R4]KZN24237.1 hypothetical protein A4G99_07325 [Haladaptatus sp. R4]
MDTSAKRRRTLIALVVVVASLVFASGVMAYRTTHQQDTQAKPTVHYTPPPTDHHRTETSSGTKTGNETGTGTGTTTQRRDDDRDGVPNSADNCPSKAGRGQGDDLGCPVVTTTHAS